MISYKSYVITLAYVIALLYVNRSFFILSIYKRLHKMAYPDSIDFSYLIFKFLYYSIGLEPFIRISGLEPQQLKLNSYVPLPPSSPIPAPPLPPRRFSFQRFRARFFKK